MAETMVRFTRAREDANSFFYISISIEECLCSAWVAAYHICLLKACTCTALSKVGSSQYHPLKHQA